jgi:hypothetical protein
MLYLNIKLKGISCRGVLAEEEFLNMVYDHIQENGMTTVDGRQRIKCVNVFATGDLTDEVFKGEKEDEVEYMGLRITRKDIQALMDRGLYAPKAADDQGRKVEGALVFIKLKILDVKGYIKLGSLCIRRQDVSASRLFMAALLKWDRSKEAFCAEIDRLLLNAEFELKGTTKQVHKIELV